MGEYFQSFWWGERLSPYEWLSLKSFVDHGHTFDLYCFDADLAVPPGVTLRDAAEIAPREEVFAYERGYGAGSPAAFANLFRYKLLGEKGGWWVDTDVVCLSPQIPRGEEFVARQDYGWINGAVMHFPPAHPVMLRCYERAKEKGRSVAWGDTGARLLTRVLDELGHTAGIRPASVCYPVHHCEVADLLLPSRSEALGERLGAALFLHLWNQTLVRSGVRKNYLPPRGSLLRSLVERHEVAGWTGEYDEPGLVASLALIAELTQQREAVPRLEAEVARQSDEIGRLQHELQQRTAAADELRAERDAVLHSRTWRATKPLRWLSGKLSSTVRRRG